MGPNPQETADLVTFNEEILNGKHHFFCAVFYTNLKLIMLIARSWTYVGLYLDIHCMKYVRIQSLKKNEIFH